MEIMPRFGARAIRLALAASIALHVAAAAPFVLRRKVGHAAAPPPAPIESAEPQDVWAGKSPFVGGEKLVDVETTEGTKPQPAPAPAPEPAPAPAPVPVPEAVQRAPKAPREPQAPASPSPEKAPRPASSAAGHAGTEGGDDGSVHPGTFGSEGQAGVRSVGRAFTRAIPPACQGDPAWGSIAAGTTFKAELILFIDAAGHVERTAFAERDVPDVIKGLVKRTLPLIESNTLSVRGGAVVRGNERMRLTVTVSDAAGRASDELDFPFFEGGRGKASFTQPNGKHVEIEVKVTKVEVAAD
jgi:hypothetical protein